jgi:hypothetical protein
MDLFGILYLVLVLAAVITFIVLLVKSAQGWGALHATMLALIFFGGVILMPLAAVVHNRRIPDLRRLDTVERDLARISADLERLKFGAFDQPRADLQTLVGLSGSVAKLQAELGRFWELELVGRNEPLDFSLRGRTPTASDDDFGDGAAPRIADVPPREKVVYGFVLKPGADGQLVPAGYMGEFLVTQSGAGSVQLKAFNELPPQLLQLVREGKANQWLVMERLPVDSHTVFAAADTSSPEAAFGTVDVAELASWLGIDAELANLDLSDPPPGISQRELLQATSLQSYLRDGQRAEQAGVLATASTTWLQLELERDVDPGDLELEGVDSEQSPFRAGQRLLVPQATGQPWIDRGYARLIDRIYVRPLDDYDHAFRQLRLTSLQSRSQLQFIQAEIDRVTEAAGLARRRINERRDERQRLDADLAQLQVERQALQDEQQRLDTEQGQLREQLMDLLTEIRQLHQIIYQSQQVLGSAKVATDT